jgi:AraC family L-rhamnose operon regulatory protein RhaS
MNVSRARPQFHDYSTVYFADACDPLEEAARQGEVTLRALARGTYPGQQLDEHVAPGVRTVGYWNAARPQHWGLDWHRNEGIEICHLNRGNLSFATREREWELRPGQITVTRPWQEHRLGSPDVGASHLRWIIIDVQVRRPHEPWKWPSWINLSAPDLNRLTSLLQQNENPVWGGDPGLRAAFHSLEDTVNNPTSRTIESELRLYTNNLLLSLLRALDLLPVPADDSLTSPKRALQMFLDELDEHLDHTWTLEEMAAACGMGRSQFSTRCRELTNMTPVEFLTFRRVQRASEALLNDPRRTITDIAIQFGFQSSQYFATTFRKQFGLSPRQYRLGVSTTDEIPAVRTSSPAA